MVVHEAQVKGWEVRDHLPPQADQRQQEDVGGWPPAAVLNEPGALHAQEAQGCPGEQGSDDQVLKMSSKLKKHMYVSCLPNCYFFTLWIIDFFIFVA